MRMQADIGNLTQDTGFFPDTPFEEGIKHAIEWQKRKWKMKKLAFWWHVSMKSRM